MLKIDLDLKLNLNIRFNQPKPAKPSVKPPTKESPTEESEDKLVDILERWVKRLQH
jgi:predicted RNA-binding protein with RPS1 domain